MPGQMSVQQALELALQHHQAGRLQEAEAIYRQILAVDPNHAETTHLLGLIALQAGKPDAAIELMQHAIAVLPTAAHYHGNLGLAFAALGRSDEAIASQQRAIALHPQYPEAYNNLGNVLRANRQFDEAAAAFHRAIELRPHFPEAYNNLGNLLRDEGHLDRAITSFRHAIELRAGFAEAHANLGQALQENGQFDESIEHCNRALSLRPDDVAAMTTLGNVLASQHRFEHAITTFRQALALRPDFVEAHNNLGNALRDSGQIEQAMAAYRQAIALDPQRAEVVNNLGAALHQDGKFEEAVSSFRQAIAMRPEFPEAWNNLGSALRDIGQVDQAIDAYRRAISLRPDWANAHYGLGTMLMLRGEFEQGWPLLENRLRDPSLHTLLRGITQPMWDGSDLNGRTLLIHAEQGFGDTIQFARYIPLAAGRGANIIVACHPELARLFQGFAGITQLITPGDSLPAFDVHAPLMTLPRIVGTTLATIPGNVPYIQTDPELSAQWRNRLDENESRFKVGLAWASRLRHKLARYKSLPLEMLAPLVAVKNAQLISLQKNKSTREPVSSGLELIDLTDELNDFADTAALIENLDLVITVDTAVAHLAGALGKPVWVMLPFAADWRWLLDRTDSPWYPTMRLFRQPRIGDWQRVIEQIAQELACQMK